MDDGLVKLVQEVNLAGGECFCVWLLGRLTTCHGLCKVMSGMFSVSLQIILTQVLTYSAAINRIYKCAIAVPSS